jgi:hypothetical protein
MKFEVIDMDGRRIDKVMVAKASRAGAAGRGDTPERGNAS